MIDRIVNRSKDYLTLLPWVEKNRVDSMKGKISCLLYHRIEDYGNHPFLDSGGSPVTSEKDFDSEIHYLKQLPTQFFTLSELNSGSFPDANTIGIIICFDDCFRCNYQQGSKILNKHDIPAVFFQSTSLINRESLIWEHSLYWLYHEQRTHSPFVQLLRNSFELDCVSDQNLITHLINNIPANRIQELTDRFISQYDLDMMVKSVAVSIYPDKNQIIKAIENGHDIASHGHGHFRRDQINEIQFEYELTHSKQLLEQITGHEPVSFSYPFNCYLQNDHDRVGKHYKNIATVDCKRIDQPINQQTNLIPRYTWPGKSSNKHRMKRWLLTGSF